MHWKRFDITCVEETCIPKQERHSMCAEHSAGRKRGKEGAAALSVCLLFSILCVGRVSSTGEPGCGSFYQDASCREDCGSCGQPCCVLEWELDLPALDVLRRLEVITFSVSDPAFRGIDGLFSFESRDPTARDTLLDCDARSIEGPTATGVITCALLKGQHQPPGQRTQKHVDELSVAVYATSQTQSKMRASSRSKFITAHCDAGRNYQTLQHIVLNLNLTQYVQTTLYGCPQK
mmetsp:Transcript_57407/g.134814  ORF Transcript_57407/g.134814 Transcript_57407/m.134814 type:complete len:234 (+) Transcript_57407:46-747(+)